jgi:hypothetical protein
MRQVALQTFSDFEIGSPGEPGACRPGERQEQTLHEMLDELVAWSTALTSLRGTAEAA